MAVARAVGLLLGVAADSWLGGRQARAGDAPGPAVGGGMRPRTPAAAAGLLGGALLAGVALERLGRRHPVLRVAGTALATWTALGGAALAAQGTAMARALDASDLAAARRTLPRLAGGHDPSVLDGPGLARAAVESVAENTSDAVVAPLLWGAVAGAPGLLGYHAVRLLAAEHGTGGLALDGAGPGGGVRGTGGPSGGIALDGAGGGMRWAGGPPEGGLAWAVARLEDVANLLPSRVTAVLTAACAPVVGGSAPGAWQVWRRDGSAHPRPSHGQVEAAFAGALEVRLGGRTPYPHGVRQRPVLGHGRTPDAGDLTRGVELSRVVGAAAAVASAVLATVSGKRAIRRSPE